MLKKAIYSFLIVLFSLGQLFLFAQKQHQNKLALISPDLNCLRVNDGGSVTLDWNTIDDPGGNFISYHIYYSANKYGPYSFVDSIADRLQSTYTHSAVNAQVQSYYYYMTTRCQPGTLTEPSDTLQTIMLTIISYTNSTVWLSWSPTQNPDVSSGLYRLYREYPSGVFNPYKFAPAFAYDMTDTFLLCNDFVRYYVENLGISCNSRSSYATAYFYDNTPPDMPVLDSVGVDLISGHPSIGWTPSIEDDVLGYIIYHSSGTWSTLDTVWGKNSSSYVDVQHSGDIASQAYRILAFDSCYNASPMTNPCNTIYLTSSFDPCTNAATISWNPYINISGALMGYKIFVSINGGAYALLTTVTANTNQYVHSNLIPQSTYNYRVQAFNGLNTTSTSNVSTVYSHNSHGPQYVYIRYASVTNENYVELSIFCDSLSSVSEYRIMRSESSMGSFIEIGKVLPISGSSLIYFDKEALVSEKAYYYQVLAVDNCGVVALSSNVAKTIFLTGIQDESFLNQLSWNLYEGWLGGVHQYNIYRAIDGVFDSNPLATIYDVSATSYTDDINSLNKATSRFSYYLVAVEGAGSPYHFQESSKSNTILVDNAPKVYVPNAFSPIGYNKIFKPVCIFVDPANYYFAVFNKWGQLVFETHNIDQGWDGMFKGKSVKDDVYVYYIRFRSKTSDYQKKTGSVSVVN